jgi:hypothetical protein
VVAVIIVARLYFTLRRLRPKHQETWDEKMVERLRAQGYAPFKEIPIDFFLALPDEAACNAVRARLEPDGFAVDVRPIEDEVTLPLSLHATKVMRLILPDVVDISKRMTALAQEFQGRYDGWAA